MFVLGVIVGGIIVGAICLAVGYALGKKKKILAQVGAKVDATLKKL